jgi:hypothetical protein
VPQRGQVLNVLAAEQMQRVQCPQGQHEPDIVGAWWQNKRQLAQGVQICQH